jgi:hypothetical protein
MCSRRTPLPTPPHPTKRSPKPSPMRQLPSLMRQLPSPMRQLPSLMWPIPSKRCPRASWSCSSLRIGLLPWWSRRRPGPRTLRTRHPAIVEVVSRQQIEEWGYQSIAEVLSKAVGFYVVDDHILPNVAVRGVSGGLLADSGVIKVLIDGRSVAFRTTAGNWLGPELIPLSAIERIEIVRGPASALYGADAFLGVVNIITRRGLCLNGTQIGGGLSFQTLQPQAYGTNLDATVGLSRGPLEVLAALRLQSEDRSGLVLPASSPAPEIPSYNARNTVASGLDRYARVGLLRLTYNLSEQSSIYATGYISSMDAGGEFSPWSQLARGVGQRGTPERKPDLSDPRLGVSGTTAAIDAEASLAVGYHRFCWWPQLIAIGSRFATYSTSSADSLDIAGSTAPWSCSGSCALPSHLLVAWVQLSMSRSLLPACKSLNWIPLRRRLATS